MSLKKPQITQAEALDEYQVVLAQDGDIEAFELLYKRWHPRLLRFAYRQTGNVEAAHDVMQEAALTIAKNITRLKDPTRFSPWAYTIIRRRAADHIGRVVRQRRIKDEAKHTPPQTGTLSVDDALTLKQALASLPETDRQLLVLFYLDGMSGKEIAAAMALPIGTVKSRLFSARAKLKTLYQTPQSQTATNNVKGDHNE